MIVSFWDGGRCELFQGVYRVIIMFSLSSWSEPVFCLFQAANRTKRRCRVAKPKTAVVEGAPNRANMAHIF